MVKRHNTKRKFINGNGRNCGLSAFMSSSTTFSTLSKAISIISSTFDSSSAKSLNLGMSRILCMGKSLQQSYIYVADMHDQEYPFAEEFCYFFMHLIYLSCSNNTRLISESNMMQSTLRTPALSI